MGRLFVASPPNRKTRLMATTTKFPRTNQELYDLGGGQPVRFPGTEEEYWALLEEAEYRVDFYNNEIIAAMSYESDEHKPEDEFSISGKTIRLKEVYAGTLVK